MSLRADPTVRPGHAARVDVSLGNGQRVSSGQVRDIDYGRESARALMRELRPATGMRLSDLEQVEEAVFTLDRREDAEN